MKSVDTLGGNVFAASLALLDILARLRRDGAGRGGPVMVQLVLRDRHLLVQWGESEQVAIASLEDRPPPEVITELRDLMENSVALVDPEILRQRNIDMMRHFDESRAKAELERKSP